MIFIMAINDGRKDLDFCQTVICSICGKYGRYQVYMTYTVFSLFFIPLFKWNRHYYVQMTCCNTVYELNPEVGRRVAARENVEITKEDLTIIRRGGWARYTNYVDDDSRTEYEEAGNCGNNASNGSRDNNADNDGSGYKGNSKDNGNNENGERKYCSNCGYSTDEDFEYCPKCGRPF